MKDIVQQLVALSKQMEPLAEQIDKRVREIAVEYASAEYDRYGSHDIPTKVNSIDDWHFEGDNIHVTWSESWNYGGFAEGKFDFPAAYLYDTKQFDDFKKLCADTKQAREDLAKERTRLEKIQQLKRLTEELGTPI